MKLTHHDVRVDEWKFARKVPKTCLALLYIVFLPHQVMQKRKGSTTAFSWRIQPLTKRNAKTHPSPNFHLRLFSLWLRDLAKVLLVLSRVTDWLDPNSLLLLAALRYISLIKGMRYACRVENDSTTAICPNPYRLIEEFEDLLSYWIILFWTFSSHDPLLQFWAYEYLTPFAPTRMPRSTYPTIKSWEGAKTPPCPDMLFPRI